MLTLDSIEFAADFILLFSGAKTFARDGQVACSPGCLPGYIQASTKAESIYLVAMIAAEVCQVVHK